MTTYEKIVKLIEQYATEESNGEDAILFMGAKRNSDGICKAVQLIPKNEDDSVLIEDSLSGSEAKDAQIEILSLAIVFCANNMGYYENFLKSVKECIVKHYSNIN